MHMQFSKYTCETTTLGIKFTFTKINEYALMHTNFANKQKPKNYYTLHYTKTITFNYTLGESIGSLMEDAWPVCNLIILFLQGTSPSNQFWTFRSCLRQEF